MQYPSYSFTTDRENSIYEFTSIGKNQAIKKLIIFAPIKAEKNLYNLSFGDANESIDKNGLINDTITSNNGDMKKVLATVFRAVLAFIQNKKECKIVFRGSTPSRTRLYRIALSNNYDELSKYFDIYGINQDGKLLYFEKDKEYIGFLINPLTTIFK
ncbi:DUF6934 family protein [Myroides profundi]|uniref:DUF6934 family protein n=1 Tax=Myroides profundi TaxID=480520 RepID=UPI0005A4810D